MRRLSALILVVLLASFMAPAGPASAATFRTQVARVPSSPTSQQSVRVWMQSDTALGETAGLEYHVGSSYVKVLGSFDNSGPAPANWRADIPAQPNGTFVEYQLFTRNQSGQDYGFSGFNWSYAVDDGDIQWNDLRHDSFDSYYRSPFGAVPAGTSVRLRFRTVPLDVDGVSVRVYQYSPATEATTGPTDYAMTYLQDRVEGGTNYAIWTVTLATPSSPAILYYKFRVTDRLDVDWYSDSYADDHDNLGQGGEGTTSDNEPFSSFQITVYNPAFQTPDWIKNANVYQIFPDRFRNGDPTNDYCVAGSTSGCPVFYGSEQPTAHTTWNETICDPRGPSCPNAYGNQFYGGDLKGITEKLDYLQGLGIDTLYLTPIFKARSNHRYDADDYLEIDPALGTQADFDELVRELERHGMYLILDGVFNHTSSDSVYFDRYHRYAGNNGACESLGSAYRGWYEFSNTNVPCGSGDYTGWFGYDSLAVLQDGSAAVRDFIYRSSADNVIKHWYLRGVGGWRFDVADEITHNWWRDFRPYAKGYDANGPLVGEVWYDASKFLLGDQLDSVMNYRFRKNILGFARGVGWKDNDNNGSNEIVGLTPSEFDRALKSVREDYPPAATAAMLNLVDSHDTNRALYVLTLLGDSGLTQAKERLKLTALFQFTYLGAPMVYYGDEAALDSPSLASGSNGPEDDPYNRAPYPWADASGNPSVYGPADTGVLGYYSTLAHLRKQHAALRTGDFTSLLAGDTTTSSSDNNTYAFARVSGTDKAVVVLNNGSGANNASIPVSGYFSDGAQLQDGLTGATYTVSGGNVGVTLAARSGAILLAAPAAADTTPPTASAVAQGANANGYNNSSPVTVDLSGSDSGSGVKELRYWVGNGALTVVSGASASVSVSTDNIAVSVRTVDKAGNVSALASVTVRIDTTAPDTTIDIGPSALSNSTSASFSFSSEAGSTFQCKLDSGDWLGCTSGQGYNNLADGSHTFQVRAIDQAGNVDPTSASFTWTIDTVAPETTIGSGPATLAKNASASFSFSGSEAGSSFACSLDGVEYSSCASPISYNSLADGSHNFEVHATDAAGNTDASPASFTWTVDTIAPITTIGSHPTTLSNSPSADFSFSSSQAGSSFQCKLDSAALAACDSPASYGGLADGSHTFTVQATDPAGNADPTPASFTWTVDTIAGDTVIDSGPSLLINSGAAIFTFHADTDDTFECSLDGSAFAACSSPASYSALADGSHTFHARSKDTAGNLDATPASFSWTVDSTAPETTIDSHPNALSNSTSASFEFSAGEAGTFECKLDNGAWVPCTSPSSHNGLADGTHSFATRAADAAGNADPTPASFSWTIDTTAPTVTITSSPANPTNSTSASFSFSSEAGSTFACSLDGAAFAPCGSPKTYSALELGDHTFEVRATDAAGNAGGPASYSWTVAQVYNFTGFFQPVDNLPALNTVKAGSAIPVKFSLGGNFGLNIFEAGYPKSIPISCQTGAQTDPIETTTNNPSGLSYDPSTGQYNYVWKTDKSWNGCHQLSVKFNDGSTQVANFKFNK
jgi:glycosidase